MEKIDLQECFRLLETNDQASGSTNNDYDGSGDDEQESGSGEGSGSGSDGSSGEGGKPGKPGKPGRGGYPGPESDPGPEGDPDTQVPSPSGKSGKKPKKPILIDGDPSKLIKKLLKKRGLTSSEIEQISSLENIGNLVGSRNHDIDDDLSGAKDFNQFAGDTKVTPWEGVSDIIQKCIKKNYKLETDYDYQHINKHVIPGAKLLQPGEFEYEEEDDGNDGKVPLIHIYVDWSGSICGSKQAVHFVNSIIKGLDDYIRAGRIKIEAFAWTDAVVSFDRRNEGRDEYHCSGTLSMGGAYGHVLLNHLNKLAKRPDNLIIVTDDDANDTHGLKSEIEGSSFFCWQNGSKARRLADAIHSKEGKHEYDCKFI